MTSAGRGKRQGAGTFASSRLEQLKPYMNEAGMGVASHPSPPDEFRKVDEIPTPMPAFSLAFLYISGVQAAESECTRFTHFTAYNMFTRRACQNHALIWHAHATSTQVLDVAEKVQV